MTDKSKYESLMDKRLKKIKDKAFKQGWYSALTFVTILSIIAYWIIK